MATKSEIKNQEYWRGRSLQLEESSHTISHKFYADLTKQYYKAAAETQREIERFYARFATENGISIDIATRILTSAEKKAYQMSLEEYTKKAKLYPFTDEYRQELENASIAYRVTRLQALQLEMRKQIDELAHWYDSGLKRTASEVYTEGYYKNIYNLQHGLGIGVTFDRLDPDKLEKLVAKPWMPDGKNFSERIWGDKRSALVNFLENDVSSAIIRGQSLDKITKAVHDKFDVAKRDAARLVQTEDAYFASTATQDAYRSQGLAEYKNVATLDSKTSSICQNMDGTHFPVEKYQIAVTAPPFHPNCRTTTAPYFEEDEIDRMFEPAQRAARDKDGKYYMVPASMPYGEWKKEHVEDASKPYTVAIKDKKGYNADNDLKEVKKAFKTLPESHKHGLERYVHKVVLGDEGVSRYDRDNHQLFVKRGAKYDEVIHELGHALETKLDLYRDAKFLEMLNKRFGDVDVYKDLELDTTTFAEPVRLLPKRDFFISDYQRRVYEEDMFGEDWIDYKTFKINVKVAQEYFAEGYREYFTNPGNLKAKDSPLYTLIKERINDG